MWAGRRAGCWRCTRRARRSRRKARAPRLGHGWELAGQVVLLSDTLRVDAYAEAIRRRVEPGGVVVDLGSGTGVMARQAARAGASRVIAVDDDPELCRLNAHINDLLGFERVIEVCCGRVEELELPESVDLVVSELIGDLADDEGMSRLLAAFWASQGERLPPGTRCVPEEVVLYGQLVAGVDGDGPGDEEARQVAAALARAEAGELWVLTHAGGLRTTGPPLRLLAVDGRGRRSGGDGEPVAGVRLERAGPPPRALLCWFEATLAAGVSLDSRGNGRLRTSWGLPLVPLAIAPGAWQPAGAEPRLRFTLDWDDDDELRVEASLA